MNHLNRRELLTVTAAGAAAVCLCDLGGVSQLLAAAGSTLDAGPLANYSKDGITPTWMASPNKIAIIRHDGKLYATSTICTHRGCVVRVDGTSNGFACPCHHATYDIAGNVTHKPATVALQRYAIAADANGHVIVDKSRAFQAGQWDDPASFIAVVAATQP